MLRSGSISRTVAAAVLVAAAGSLLAPGPAEGRTPRRSPDGVWMSRRAPGVEATAPGAAWFSLNRHALRRVLRRAPGDGRPDAWSGAPTLRLPMPDGGFARFRIVASPIYAGPERRGHGSVRTYRGRGVDDRSATARLDLTPLGFHAQVLSASGTVLVDPVGGRYRSVARRDLRPAAFRCDTDAAAGLAAAVPLLAPPSGDRLRTYRLAVTATGEYTTFLGGAAAASAQIATTVNRVTGILEREAAVRLEIAAETIYDDPATDPFTSGGIVDAVLLDEHQADLDLKVGAAGYDLGHLFTQGPDAGLAGVGVTCADGAKGRGASSRANPAGDSFDVEAVAHGIAHQLGAHHSFNGTTGDCGAARDAATAFEPGSGSTLMGFAGRCGAEDVQAASDDYLHAASFDEIAAFRDGPGALCGTESPTGNTPPGVDAGPDFVIPRGTPFTLTATAADPDGDAVTLGWEQLDLGAASPPPPLADGPLFRSLPPTASPSRTFPAFGDLLAGTPSPWERLPEVDRTMTFRVTARDGRDGGGGVAADEAVLTVSGEPFVITDPGPGASLECGDVAALAWQVGGGAVAAEVRVLLSLDAGQSFAELVAATPNDGAEAVSVPRALVPEARLLLEPLDNVFFALSGPLEVVDTLPPVVEAPPDVVAECTSPEGTPVDIGTAAATDLCDASVTVTNDAPALFPLGMTTVLWTAVDASGNAGSDPQLVTVVDTTPPSISVELGPTVLWPPNHKLVDVTAVVTASDACDAAPAVRLASITSDEPDNGRGDGNTTGDVAGAEFGADDREFQLRAERRGGGAGRTYTVTYEAVDASGNVAAAAATVFVPHDRGR